MVKFINKRTCSTMWVADDRVEEYKAAGHKLAANPTPEKPIMNEPEVAEQVEDEPVKKYVRRKKR